MADKMLIDASHEEETRVVVVRGNRIEEFDFESQHKKQLRGNIYLAKVTRVEPSLQAAFVEYGGNRHGFLAFSEIHPDYYQIPVADRQALIEAEAEEARADDDDSDVEKPTKKKSRTRRSRSKSKKEAKAAAKEIAEAPPAEATEPATETSEPDTETAEPVTATAATAPSTEVNEQATDAEQTTADPSEGPTAPRDESVAEAIETPDEEASAQEASAGAMPADETGTSEAEQSEDQDKKQTPDTIAAAVDTDQISEPVGLKEPADMDEEDDDDEGDRVESVGAEDALEEVPDRTRKPRKQYRIQEVIKRRQILLVQVVKEERGNKGAALTTYLSLAGRYSVLMPNTARGGGISRKITNVQDRKRLKEIARGLDVPQGMGVILRTAGANRTKAEIKRDFEYLMRLWENVRNLTLNSTAPCLVYEEGSLIKRSIRDLYNKDIGEIIVSGDLGYREAKDFMKMLMPSHAKAVQPYRDVQPIFARSGIESQLDKILQPQVTLKSGGYVIINQTEALVAIDVNSGRSTKEHSIEDTALRTNLEAAEEVARQLRLRDLAGLIVIDFIDMEEKRNNRAVEKKLKECLKSDRARIQVGRVSHFGLLEMSRQRIRASVLESTMQVCEHCGGTGYVRSVSSVALHVLRTVEEHLLRDTKHHISARTQPQIALYLLNQKRDTIIDFESRFGLSITIEADPDVGAQHVAIDQGESVDTPVIIENIVQVDSDFDLAEDDVEEAVSSDDDGNGRKRKRRRRRPRTDGDNADMQAAEEARPTESDAEEIDASNDAEAMAEDDSEQRKKRRRRGKRGGRRHRETEAEAETDAAAQAEDTADADGPADNIVDLTQIDKPVETPMAADATESASVSEVVTAEQPVTEDAPATDVDVTTVVADAAETDAEEKPKRRSRRKTADDDTAAEPKVTSSSSESADAADDKPKKAGWWQRRGFF